MFRVLLGLAILTFLFIPPVASAGESGALLRDTALGLAPEPGAKLNCPISQGVFVRESDRLRFVADGYGVFVERVRRGGTRNVVRFDAVTEVVSGALAGRRAYLQAAHATPGATGATTSSWRNEFKPLRASGGPPVAGFGAAVGPLEGFWTLVECRPSRRKAR